MRHNLPSFPELLNMPNVRPLGQTAQDFVPVSDVKTPEELYAETLGDRRCDLGLTAGVALAHGPSRQKVTESIEINAPADKVWAAVGNFQDMSWLPIVAKTEGTGGNDVNATRKLTLKNGGIVEEQLDKYDAASTPTATKSRRST